MSAVGAAALIALGLSAIPWPAQATVSPVVNAALAPAPGVSRLSSIPVPTAAASTHQPALPPAVSPEEEKIGKEGVKEVEDEYDIVKDPVTLAKMQQMVATLETATPYPNLHYTVNIVKSKHPLPEPEINAFSLPGGYIFATKDLVDSVQSDDELAAVLGHEMAHVVHHHVIRQIRSRNHDEMVSIIPIILDLLVNGFKPNADTPSVAVMSQQVVQALQSPHSIHDETEADMSGIEYMYGSHKYNPVGMLTFMQRLAQDEERHVQVEMGYLQTHPSSSHRVEDIRAKLRQLGVPINVRSVTKALVAVAEAGAKPGTAVVRMKKTDICTLLDAPDGSLTAMQRADAAASAINRSLDAGQELADLDIRPQGTGCAVVWGAQRLFQITSADAASEHQDASAAAAQALDRLRKVLWADDIDHT